MYSIRWYDGRNVNMVVGEIVSILAITNLLENKNIKFKVANVSGFVVDQESVGVGGYSCWLKEDEHF